MKWEARAQGAHDDAQHDSRAGRRCVNNRHVTAHRIGKHHRPCDREGEAQLVGSSQGCVHAEEADQNQVEEGQKQICRGITTKSCTNFIPIPMRSEAQLIVIGIKSGADMRRMLLR